MALTQVKTTGIADDAVTTDKLANAINTARDANTAKATNATHTGDVTGSGSLTIADNAVTLAKMAGGTDGQIITYDANGDPVAVGPGTDGQVLTSTGAGSPPAFEDVPAGGATINNATENEIVTVASNTAQLDAESTLTYDGQTLAFNSTTPAIRFEDSDSTGTPITDIDGGGGDLDIKIDTGDEKAGNKLRVYTNGTEIVRVSDDGNVKIQDGDLVIGTAGHGISFAATGDASGTGVTMSNELLDDYEEGTWTPLAGGSSGATVSQAGYYVRVGTMVTVWGFVRRTSGGSNNIDLEQLPYQANEECVFIPIRWWWGSGTQMHRVMGEIRNNESHVRLYKQTGVLNDATDSYLTWNEVSSGYDAQFSFHCSYRVD